MRFEGFFEKYGQCSVQLHASITIAKELKSNRTTVQFPQTTVEVQKRVFSKHTSIEQGNLFFIQVLWKRNPNRT